MCRNTDRDHQITHRVGTVGRNERPIGKPDNASASCLFNALAQQVGIGERTALNQQDAQCFGSIGRRSGHQRHDMRDLTIRVQHKRSGADHD